MHLISAFGGLQLLGIQQTGHMFNIYTHMHHVRKLENQTDVIDETLWNQPAFTIYIAPLIDLRYFFKNLPI